MDLIAQVQVADIQVLIDAVVRRKPLPDSMTELNRKLNAPLGLDVQALLVEVGQQAVVRLVEDVARERRQPREDVSGGAGVLAACHPRPELAYTRWHMFTVSLSMHHSTEHVPLAAGVSMLEQRVNCLNTQQLPASSCWRSCCSRCGLHSEPVLHHSPEGTSRLTLLLPTKSCARPTMVPARLASPWWYAACSLT